MLMISPSILLPILECPEAAEGVKAGDLLEVDLESGRIEDLTTGESYQAKPYPPFMLAIIEAGGLIPQVKARLGL